MSTSTPKRGQLSFLPDEKKCPGCKKVLPVTEFYSAKDRRDGLRSYCKSCESSKSRKWYKDNYKLASMKLTLRRLKERARKKNIPIEITLEYLKNSHPDDMICPVLGIKMERGYNDDDWYSTSPSVDRIVPEKGYVPGNIIIVSNKANLIKSYATPDEVLKVGTFYKKLLEEMEDGSETD